MPGGKPLVVARRWDQLGGRLNTMANGIALAEMAGDVDFRFVWVRGFDLHVNDPLELFERAFLDEFEIGEADIDPLLGINSRFIDPTAEAVSGALAQAPAGSFIEADHVFGVVRAHDESDDTARERFKRCFASMGWNAQVRKLIAFCDGWSATREIAAVHIRAGDIVSGDWNQTVVHSKYCPTPFVHDAIRRFSDHGDKPVLVFSDHPEYLAWLGREFNVVTAAEVIPGYSDLTHIQQALADILLMSRCRPILGPPTSGFSLMASWLGAGEFERVDAAIESGDEREVLLKGIDERLSEPDPEAFWGPLIARDACWANDVFGDAIGLDRQLELAIAATRVDPDFAGSHTHLARVAMLRGESQMALDAAERARPLVQPAEGADPLSETDPLFEVLAIQIAVGCFATIHAEATLRRILVQRFSRRSRILAPIQEKLALCAELEPFWTDAPTATEALRGIVRATREIIYSGPRVRRRTARGLTGQRFEQSAMTAIKPDGLQRHRAAEVFDAVTPDLERYRLHLYEAACDAGLTGTEPPSARES